MLAACFADADLPPGVLRRDSALCHRSARRLDGIDLERPQDAVSSCRQRFGIEEDWKMTAGVARGSALFTASSLKTILSG